MEPELCADSQFSINLAFQESDSFGTVAIHHICKVASCNLKSSFADSIFCRAVYGNLVFRKVGNLTPILSVTSVTEHDSGDKLFFDICWETRNSVVHYCSSLSNKY